jgi:hypothetical protein
VKLPPPSLARTRLATVESIRSWLAPAPGRDDVQRDPRTLSFAYALLFGSGAVLVLFTLLLPHSPERSLPGLIGPATAAMVVTVAMADSVLYQAKRTGRNRALSSPSAAA